MIPTNPVVLSVVSWWHSWRDAVAKFDKEAQRMKSQLDRVHYGDMELANRWFNPNSGKLVSIYRDTKADTLIRIEEEL